VDCSAHAYWSTVCQRCYLKDACLVATQPGGVEIACKMLKLHARCAAPFRCGAGSLKRVATLCDTQRSGQARCVRFDDGGESSDEEIVVGALPQRACAVRGRERRSLSASGARSLDLERGQLPQQLQQAVRSKSTVHAPRQDHLRNELAALLRSPQRATAEAKQRGQQGPRARSLPQRSPLKSTAAKATRSNGSRPSSRASVLSTGKRCRAASDSGASPRSKRGAHQLMEMSQVHARQRAPALDGMRSPAAARLKKGFEKGGLPGIRSQLRLQSIAASRGPLPLRAVPELGSLATLMPESFANKFDRLRRSGLPYVPCSEHVEVPRGIMEKV
jgi:hypothetical protein